MRELKINKDTYGGSHKIIHPFLMDEQEDISKILYQNNSSHKNN